jgi:hypothetical protein
MYINNVHFNRTEIEILHNNNFDVVYKIIKENFDVMEKGHFNVLEFGVTILSESIS